MNQIVFQERTQNFRISHIVQESNNDMKKRHMHVEYELYFLVKGERYYFIDDKTYHISADTLVLIPSGTIHRTSTVNSETNHERILLILNEGWINSFLRKIGIPALSSYFAEPILHVDPTKSKYLLKIFDDIYTELSKKQVNYEVAVQLKIVELLLFISRSTNTCANISAPFVSKSGKHQKVTEATLYIKNHFQEPISLQNVADHVFVSRGYLSNIFNEVTGVKLTEYINIQRINYAKELLTNSTLSITEVASNSGFESITYFEKVFNQATGNSPLKYRQSMLDER